jgi:hypothetical protein
LRGGGNIVADDKAIQIGKAPHGIASPALMSGTLAMITLTEREIGYRADNLFRAVDPEAAPWGIAESARRLPSFREKKKGTWSMDN